MGKVQNWDELKRRTSKECESKRFVIDNSNSRSKSPHNTIKLPLLTGDNDTLIQQFEREIRIKGKLVAAKVNSGIKMTK